MWMLTRSYSTDDFERDPEPVGDDQAAMDLIERMHAGHNDVIRSGLYPGVPISFDTQVPFAEIREAVRKEVVARRRIQFDLTRRECHSSSAELNWIGD